MNNLKDYPFLLFYTPQGRLFLTLALAWSVIWKGIALWKAGRNNQPWWFVALLVINTFGILEIIYIFLISKRKQNLSI